jgi:hypothetical protein
MSGLCSTGELLKLHTDLWWPNFAFSLPGKAGRDRKEDRGQEKGRGAARKSLSLKLHHRWLWEALREAIFIPIVEHSQRRHIGYYHIRNIEQVLDQFRVGLKVRSKNYGSGTKIARIRNTA